MVGWGALAAVAVSPGASWVQAAENDDQEAPGTAVLPLPVEKSVVPDAPLEEGAVLQAPVEESIVSDAPQEESAVLQASGEEAVVPGESLDESEFRPAADFYGGVGRRARG